MVSIPFSFLPSKILTKLSDHFMGLGIFLSKLFPFIQLELDRANFNIETERYLAMCLVANLFLSLFTGFFLVVFLSKIGKLYLGIIIAFVFFIAIFFIQLNYPKLVSSRRIRKLDTDLLSSLRAIMIQLNSGVPLFEAIVIISNQEFGEVSKEFKKAVKRINAGVPQIESLEEMALKNPSPYLRRALWQIINGMKEGATIKDVIGNVITNLTKEQVIQIEKYGSQLKPFAMFYMMGAVIMPTLSITFLIVITSFINLEPSLVKLIFWGLLVFVVFLQIMFAGILKTKRPSLLGE